MFCIKNMSYKKLAKYGVFSSIIFFSLFILYNFGNAQYLGQYTTPSGGTVVVTAGVRPGIDAQFPGGLSIFSPYEAQILGYDTSSHPISQLGLAMQNLGLSLPGYGNGPIYSSPFIFGDTMVSPYIIPGVGGGVSGYSGGYGSPYGGYGGSPYGGYGGSPYGGYGGSPYGGYGGLGGSLYGGNSGGYGGWLYGGNSGGYGGWLYGGNSGGYGGGLYGGYGSSLYGGYGSSLYGGYGGLYGLGGMYGGYGGLYGF